MGVKDHAFVHVGEVRDLLIVRKTRSSSIGFRVPADKMEVRTRKGVAGQPDIRTPSRVHRSHRTVSAVRVEDNIIISFAPLGVEFNGATGRSEVHHECSVFETCVRAVCGKVPVRKGIARTREGVRRERMVLARVEGRERHIARSRPVPIKSNVISRFVARSASGRRVVTVAEILSHLDVANICVRELRAAVTAMCEGETNFDGVSRSVVGHPNNDVVDIDFVVGAVHGHFEMEPPADGRDRRPVKENRAAVLAETGRHNPESNVEVAAGMGLDC